MPNPKMAVLQPRTGSHPKRALTKTSAAPPTTRTRPKRPNPPPPAAALVEVVAVSKAEPGSAAREEAPTPSDVSDHSLGLVLTPPRILAHAGRRARLAPSPTGWPMTASG